MAERFQTVTDADCLLSRQLPMKRWQWLAELTLRRILASSFSVAGFTALGCESGCRTLQVGDEVVVKIDNLEEPNPPLCNRELLGLEDGTELWLKVEEQREVVGSDFACLASTGSMTTETGWTYQRSTRGGWGTYMFEAELDASRGSCSGEVSLDVFGRDESPLEHGPVPARVVFRYTAKVTGEDCPLTCEESFTGTMERVRP